MTLYRNASEFGRYVRSAPSVAGGVVGMIRPGVMVEISDEQPIDAGGYRWCEIVAPGHKFDGGFVAVAAIAPVTRYEVVEQFLVRDAPPVPVEPVYVYPSYSAFEQHNAVMMAMVAPGAVVVRQSTSDAAGDARVGWPI